MSSVQLLPGITQKKVKTDRLEIAYLEAGSGNMPIILVHGNCSSSHYFQDFMLALAVNFNCRHPKTLQDTSHRTLPIQLKEHPPLD